MNLEILKYGIYERAPGIRLYIKMFGKIIFMKKILLLFLKFLIPDKFIELNIEGIKFITNPYRMPQWRAYMSRNILPEQKLLLTFADFCKSSKTVIDIGAHWGLYSMFASKSMKEKGSVIAIEPSYNNFQILLENISINKITNIKPLNFAIGNKNKPQNLYHSEYGIYDTFLLNKRSKGRQNNFEITEMRKFDDIARNVSSIDVIKVDIEGAEGLFMDGAIESFKNRKIKSIFMEMHSALIDFGYQDKELIERFFEAGFIVYYLNERKNCFVNSAIGFKPPYYLVAILKGHALEGRLKGF